MMGITQHPSVPALIALGSVLCHLVLASYLCFWGGPTLGESRHVAAAIAVVGAGYFGLYPQSGTLPHLVAGLPLVARGWHAPPPGDSRGEWVMWQSRYETLDDLGALWWLDLALARMAMLGFTVLAAAAVYVAALQVWGPWAGAAAVAAWCFHPHVLTWAATLSHDVAGAALGLWACVATASYLARRSTGAAAGSGLMWGLAVLCRVSNLVPALGALFLILAGLGTRSFGSGWIRRVKHGIVAMLALVLTINLGYAFSGTGRPIGSVLLTDLARPFALRLFGSNERLVWFSNSFLGRLPSPLPQPLIEGFCFQSHEFWSRVQYLSPGYRPRATWWLEGFARKTPVGLLVWAAAGLVALVTSPLSRKASRRLFLAGVLLAWVVYYGGFLTGLGRWIPYLRYGTPVLAGGIVLLAGGVASRLRVVRWAASAAVVAGAVELLWSFPHTASYFNPIFGGIEAAQGRVHAVDIDNGQDAWHVLRWLERHPEARPAVVALGASFAAMPVVWQEGVRRAAPTPRPHRDEWVVVSLARWPLVQELLAERRRCVARPTPATRVFAPRLTDPQPARDPTIVKAN